MRAKVRGSINPYFGVTMNDQFVSHDAPGVALNFYLTNVLAIGARNTPDKQVGSPSPEATLVVSQGALQNPTLAP